MDINKVRIIRHERIDSTNDEAKRLIACAGGADSIPFDTVIVAGEQTAGRGRSGRDFVSPKADSLYMSFVLRPGKAVGRAAVRSNGRETTGKQMADTLHGGRKTTGEQTERALALPGGREMIGELEKEASCDERGVIREQAAGALPGRCEVTHGQVAGALSGEHEVTHEQATGVETPLTIIAAVAVCEAIEAMDSQAGVTPKIKWVNDIYVDGRKVCGILAEAMSGKGGKSIDAIVLGIGVNINACTDVFPPDIRDIAGSLTMGKGDVKSFMYKIISRICTRMGETTGTDTDTGGRFFCVMGEAIGAETNEQFPCVRVLDGDGQTCTAPNSKEPSPCVSGLSVMDEYRRRSLMPGREITVVRADGQTARAVAQRIEDDGNLTVMYPDGTSDSLNAGEVHLVMGT